MEEQALQFRVRKLIVDAFSYGKYAETPFESLVRPTKNFGIRGKSDTEIFALRLGWLTQSARLAMSAPRAVRPGRLGQALPAGPDVVESTYFLQRMGAGWVS